MEVYTDNPGFAAILLPSGIADSFAPLDGTQSTLRSLPSLTPFATFGALPTLPRFFSAGRLSLGHYFLTTGQHFFPTFLRYLQHFITHLEAEPRGLDVICPMQRVDDLADAAGTIGYEILTSLGTRYRRRYVGDYVDAGA